MSRTVDHIAFGGTELYELRATTNEVGLTPTYGGGHRTRTTHITVVPSLNGSYFGLIAPTPGTDATDASF